MHVLHFINSLQTGGAERLLTELLPQLQSRGVRCSVLSIEPTDTTFGKQLRESGIRVSSMQAAHAYSPLAGLLAIRALRRADCDLVHAHLYPAQLLASLAVSHRSCAWRRLVVTEHSTSNWRRGIAALRPSERWMYHRIDVVACISDATRESLIASVGHGVNALTIPNGIDLARLQRPADSVTSSASELPPLTVLSTGRLVKSKGYAYLIDALPYLDPQVHVAICGDGPLQGDLRRQAINKRVDHRFHLLGNRTDVARLMHSSALYVQPSLYDGFGIAALEAMACGLPVIHSGCAGLAAVVGEAGLAVNVREPIALAEAINRVLGDEALRRRMATSATTQAATFSIERTADEYLALYRGTVAA